MPVRTPRPNPRPLLRCAIATAVLGAFGCAAYPTTAPDRLARLVPMSSVVGPGRTITLHGGHPGGGTAAVALRRGSAYGMLAVVHRWVVDDVHQYDVALRRRTADGRFEDLEPPLVTTVLAKDPDAAGAILFTDLAHGEVYQAEVVARGNKKGTAPDQVLNTQRRALATFDFSADQDVEDTLVAEMAVVLDGMAFSGKATVVIAPQDGDYGRPDAEPSAEPVATPTPAGTATPTAEGTPTPQPTATAAPDATPTPAPTATPTPDATPTPVGNGNGNGGENGNGGGKP